MKKILFVLAFISNIHGEPWIDVEDFNELEIIKQENIICNVNDISLSKSFPISYGEIIKNLDTLNTDDDYECKKKLNKFKKTINNNFYKPSLTVGFQSKLNDTYFQTIGKRYQPNSNLNLTYTDAFSNFALKMKVSRDLKENKYFFDESYISYKFDNTVFSIGKVSRWWSPSEHYSLILSNSARPSKGVEIRNYIPIEPKRKYLSYLGEVNYEIFLNRLEKNRTIPNALLFGNRVSIKPSESLHISLMRLAQFGGDGRPTDSSTILNMILGRDNTSENLTFEEQPGNQIAGFDISYHLNDIIFYGQLIGEDEAGLFPSRKLKLIGSSWSSERKIIPLKISIDYIDTFSGIINYSYNHSLYKDGLRYYKIPIGASIDADSKSLVTSFKTSINNTTYKVTINKIDLNKNNSPKNAWSISKQDFYQINFFINKKFGKFDVEFHYIHRNKSIEEFKKNNAFMNITYKFK